MTIKRILKTSPLAPKQTTIFGGGQELTKNQLREMLREAAENTRKLQDKGRVKTHDHTSRQ
jgi:hypothetical protein